MEQNKKVDPKIKGIKFVMDNGEEKYLKRIICIWMRDQY